MIARRLIVAPVVALAAMLLVGAIIDSGQRARLARAVEPSRVVVPQQPALAAEARRVREAVDSASRCTGAPACTPEVMAARIRDTAQDVEAWPPDRRFLRVRASLRAQLHAQALVLDQRAADAVDGRSTYRTRARLRLFQARLDDATLEAIRAQRAAGLISRPEYDVLIRDLT